MFNPPKKDHSYIKKIILLNGWRMGPIFSQKEKTNRNVVSSTKKKMNKNNNIHGFNLISHNNEGDVRLVMVTPLLPCLITEQ